RRRGWLGHPRQPGQHQGRPRQQPEEPRRRPRRLRRRAGRRLERHHRGGALRIRPHLPRERRPRHRSRPWHRALGAGRQDRWRPDRGRADGGHAGEPVPEPRLPRPQRLPRRAGRDVRAAVGTEPEPVADGVSAGKGQGLAAGVSAPCRGRSEQSASCSSFLRKQGIQQTQVWSSSALAFNDLKALDPGLTSPSAVEKRFAGMTSKIRASPAPLRATDCRRRPGGSDADAATVADVATATHRVPWSTYKPAACFEAPGKYRIATSHRSYSAPYLAMISLSCRKPSFSYRCTAAAQRLLVSRYRGSACMAMARRMISAKRNSPAFKPRALSRTPILVSS